MINWVTIIGLVAAICTTIAFFPQVIKIAKTKKTQDISLHMYILLTTGIFLWLVYGLIINDLPLIFANLISLILATSVLVFKIKYK